MQVEDTLSCHLTTQGRTESGLSSWHYLSSYMYLTCIINLVDIIGSIGNSGVVGYLLLISIFLCSFFSNTSQWKVGLVSLPLKTPAQCEGPH